MKKIFFLIFCFITLFPYLTIGNEVDSLKQKKSGFLLLPIVFYSPETRLAAGTAVHYYFHTESNKLVSRPSSVLPAITYTQNKQIMSEINTDLYWKNDAYQISGRLAYIKFPTKFFGIGSSTLNSAEEKYTPKTFSLKLKFFKKVFSSLRAGVQYEFEQEKIIKMERNGLLARGNILGSAGGFVSGAGIRLNWDTRNNIYFPSFGSFLQCSAVLFSKKMGSDFSFNRYTLDIRKYWSLFPAQALALQGYLNIIMGHPPFQMMSLLGGRERMRGYLEGRFRDNDMMVFQIEYRIVPLWWKFGLAGFLGLGHVAANVRSFDLRKFKYSVGCGLRYMFDRQEKIDLRLDFAYGQNSSGVYLTIGEAF